MKRICATASCAICNNSDFIRYPYNKHNRIAKKFFKYYKYYLSLFISPILKLKVFNPNYYRINLLKKRLIWLNNLANWAKEDVLFSPRFDILKCKKCGYGVYDRQLDVKFLHKYFNDTYLPHPVSISSNEYHNESLYLEDIRAIGQYNFVKDELRHFSKINMLEIGGGGTLFPRLVREKHQGQVFINVVEANDFWVPYYNELGIKLIAKFFPEGEIDQKFNYIHVSFCLEYVYDLFGAINKLRYMLTEDGLLFIAVPNCNSDWYSLDLTDTPRIHFFAKESLANLMENYHFKVLSLQEYGLTHYEQCMRERAPNNFDEKILEEANISIRENTPRADGNCLRGLFTLKNHSLFDV
ncbi:MAG: methyltransferase domain-containing protein [Candidatus Kuenenia stuttgartiensis]|nr:methyltransferase domain-containing protein [Candidatus Kuenenia stuttgartiensis]